MLELSYLSPARLGDRSCMTNCNAARTPVEWGRRSSPVRVVNVSYAGGRGNIDGGMSMPFGDALEPDADGSWRTRTEIASYFADQASRGVVTVLSGGTAAVVPADVALAGLRALGRAVPAELSDQTLGEARRD